MRILLHVCCGPCSIRVIQILMEQGHSVTGLFYNPNIHPLAEYMRRRQGAIEVFQKLMAPLILADTLPIEEQMLCLPYSRMAVNANTTPPASTHSLPAAPVNLPNIPPAASPNEWLAAVAASPANRCPVCWYTRLEKSASFASQHGYDAFTSSLLYSRRQQHGPICDVANQCAAQNDIAFFYQDFRTEWQQGITLSKEWGIYRQNYCGCIYSEYDRFSRDLERACAPQHP